MDTNESHFTLPEAPKKPKLSVRLKQKGILRPYTIATAVLFGCAVLVYVLARFWTAFAEFWARYPSQGLRFILAKLTSWIPFSLAEALILSLPVLAAAYIIYSNRALNRSDSPRAFWSCLMPLICAIFLLLSYFSETGWIRIWASSGRRSRRRICATARFGSAAKSRP